GTRNAQRGGAALRARRRSASRVSSCASLSTTACWPASRSIFPAATRTAYCTETEADMNGRDGALQEGDGIAALRRHPQAELFEQAAQSRSTAVRDRRLPQFPAPAIPPAAPQAPRSRERRMLWLRPSP